MKKKWATEVSARERQEDERKKREAEERAFAERDAERRRQVNNKEGERWGRRVSGDMYWNSRLFTPNYLEQRWRKSGSAKTSGEPKKKRNAADKKIADGCSAAAA